MLEPVSIALAGTLALSVLPRLCDAWVSAKPYARRMRRDGIIDIEAAHREGRTRGAVCAPADAAQHDPKVRRYEPRTPPFRAPRKPIAFTRNEDAAFAKRVEALLADALGVTAEKRAFASTKTHTKACEKPRPDMPWMDARGWE